MHQDKCNFLLVLSFCSSRDIQSRNFRDQGHTECIYVCMKTTPFMLHVRKASEEREQKHKSYAIRTGIVIFIGNAAGVENNFLND